MSGARDRAPILVATDFSDDAAAAFEWAADTARAFDAPLHVLHVVHDRLDQPGTYAGRLDGLEEKATDVAREMLDEWVEARVAEQATTGRASVEVDSALVQGIPETRILEVAEQLGARMIVMGGQGQTRLSHILLGSRVERVARLSRIPVTIVRSEPPAGDVRKRAGGSS